MDISPSNHALVYPFWYTNSLIRNTMRISVSHLMRTAFFLVGIFLTSGLAAQSPITVTINVLPPYPNYVDEVVEMGDQTIITLQNTDISSSYSVKLRAILSGNNGITVRTRESALPNTPIDMEPGETVVLTGEELSVFYNSYSENDFDFIGISEQDIINNQQLPDGSYTICLRAFDYQSDIPLSANSPSGCSQPFTVVSVDPPIITVPQNNTTVATTDPQFLNINWIPVSISLPDLRYRLEMVDLTDFPMNPYDAFETGDFLFFAQDDIMANTFLYGMEHPLLTPGHEYAIRVRAYRDGGPLNVSNDGYSDIVLFTYGETDEDGDENDDGEGEITSDVPDQNFGCGESCNFTLSSNQTPAESRPQAGDMLSIGNFQMRVSSIQGSDSYSGEGVIQATDYMPVGIKVEFEDIQVNDEGRVFEGTAKSVLRTEPWIDETWSDIQTASEDITLNANTMSQAVATLTDPQYYIENLQGIYEQVGTTLPFTIGSGSNRLEVVGMNFFPERASYNLTSIIELNDDPDGTQYLHFMAKDLCITPGGVALSADEARLELVKPIRYTFDSSTQLEFKPAASGGGGTYLTFDCDGFNGVFAQGDVVFSPDVIRPVDAEGDIIEGDTVRADFSTNFTSWSSWVATVNFGVQGSGQDDENRFMYTELEDYMIGVNQAYIDHSISANPDGMVFPENYTSNAGPDWQGVYLKSLEVTLPEWIKTYDDAEARVQLSGTNLIIDGRGLTGVISADNVLSQKEGAMGKWPITVDEVRLRIVENSLAQAAFNGDLKIPIIEEPFSYQADLQFLAGRTEHTFSFSTVNEYTIPMWFANTTLEDNSSLSVEISDASAYVEANLNGNISFSPSIGDIDKNNLTNITFEDFTIRSQKEPDYIEIGHIGTGATGEKLAVAGFGILLESLDWNEESSDLSSLDLGLAMDLSGDMFGISGGTGLKIKNSIDDLVDSLSFNYEGTDVQDIYLDVNAGVVDVKGSIGFFKDDEKFGDGFSGSLSLSFIESIKLEGSVLFGNVNQDGNEFNYWYARAMAYLPTTPVPMATPLDIYGFGGGVYKNLALKRDFPNPRGVNGTGSATIDDIFEVQEGVLGLQASVICGLTPSSTTFNADVGLTAEINTNTGGLNLLALTGEGYMMQELEEEDKGHSMIKAEVAISYDFPNKTLSAQFGVDGKIPYSSPMLTLDGNIDIYRSPNLWYLKAGIPTEPMSANIDLGISGISANGYFMTGQELPPPVLPRPVIRFFRFDSHLVNNTQNGLGIGFMAGVHLDMDIDLSLLGTGVNIDGLAGVDLAVLNYFAATCNGSENFGVNKWYAQGQAYLYGKVALELFTKDVAGLELGIIVEGAFPNPTGVRGIIRAKASLLTIDVDFNERFHVGSFCDIQPLEDADEMIERKEKELDNLALLGFVTPANGKPRVSTAVKPTVQFFQKDRTLKRFTYGDGLGGIIDKLYRIRNEVKWEKKSPEGNQWSDVNHSINYSTQDSIMTLKPTNANGDPTLINGGTTYRITAKSYIQNYTGNTSFIDFVNAWNSDEDDWAIANYTEGENKGEPIMEKKIHSFDTGSNLTEIEEMYVDYTLPYPRQRFYPYEYLSTGKIKFNVDQEPKFQDFENCGFEIYAEFSPVDGTQPPPRQRVVRPNLLQAQFTMSTLNAETVYKLQIVAERRVTQLEVELMDDPACALPNAADPSNDGGFGDYLADNGINTDMTNFVSSSNMTLAGAPPMQLGENSIMNQISGYELGPASSGIQGVFEMMGDTITHRKILYTIYFRTSKYATPEEKMNSMAISEFTVSPQYFSMEYVPQTVVKDIVLKVDCGEGFDKYDLYGHDYATTETKEYFRFSGASCRSISFSGLGYDVSQWFEDVCPKRFGTSGLPESGTDATEAYNNMIMNMQETLPGLDMVFKSDPSNYTGIKHIEPLLSDAEVGLSSGDALINYSGMPVYGSGIVSGSGSVLTEYAINTGWFTGATSGSLSPSTVTVSGPDGDPELEIKYELDRRAAEMHSYLMEDQVTRVGGVDPEDFPYVSPPEGDYPLKIRLMNIPESQNEQPNYKSRTFNVTIPY